MRKIFIVTLVFMAFVGCANQDGTKVLITACNGYAVALSTAAEFRKAGKLDAVAVAKIDTIDRQVGPTCTAPRPSLTAVSLQVTESLINAATAEIQDIIANAKGK